jgi:RNA polymerase sigma factor (TIGR02999 family)
MSDRRGEATKLLFKLKAGDEEALGKLLPIVYPELRRIAGYYMRRERKNHTLQPTALLLEACVKLVEGRTVDWKDRAHFIAVFAQTMRRILVDYARARLARKRGGKLAVRIQFEEAMDCAGDRDVPLLELDEALTNLEAADPIKARVVELRFFGGASEDEIAQMLNISIRSVQRHWSVARTKLYEEMRGQKRSAG